jgi:glycosyltransferase involved in cell wall biosynthesis
VRIVVLNAAYDPALPSPEALVDRYETLTGWCRALTAAGATVQVAQRFHSPARLDRDGVRYLFMADGGPAAPSAWWASRPLIDAALADRPDIVHLNGLGYPRLISGIKALRPATRVVVQDHGGASHPSPERTLSRDLILRPGLGRADACLFTSTDQARPWHEAGLITRVPVLDIVESSTDVRGCSRHGARGRTGINGDPAILWVGRLDANKDPVTMIEALERVMAIDHGAHAHFVYQGGPLEAALRDRILHSPALTGRVTLVGAVPHERIADYYSAADVFVSASHEEGSGYALIEALACGTTPIVTDIPPFRAIAAGVGARFAPGDSAGCAVAMLDLLRGDRETLRRAARARFDAALSWEAIGQRAMAHYRAVMAAPAR